MPAQEQSATQTQAQKTVSEKVLFSWVAPERPFKRRTRDFWISLSAIASIVSLIIFLIEGPISVILIISLVFLFYMLSTVEPQTIKYEITDLSINIAETKNDINMFGRYWFGKRFDSNLLILETFTIPGRLELVIHEKDIETITKVLNEYLIQEEVALDNIERASGWLSDKIPGNN